MSFFSEENSKKSMQRLALFLSLIASSYLLAIVGAYILTKGLKCENIAQDEWFGMTAFVFFLLLGLGVMAGIKAYQKKFENITPNKNE